DKELTDQRLNRAAVRRVDEHATVKPAFAVHRFGLRQRHKAFFTVVVTHAGRADAAKGHIVLGDVHQCIVDGDATGVGAFQNFLLLGFVVAEEIQRQRPVVIVDIADGVIQRAVRHDGQDRAEQFFLHHFHVGAAVLNNVQWHFAGAAEIFVGRVYYGDVGAFIGGIFHPALQALLLTFVDDGGVIIVVTQGRVHARKSSLIGVDKSLFLTGRQQDVIGGNTGLAGVQGFAETDALDGIFHIGAGGDNGRRFAAQFQSDGGQVFRRRAHHNFAHRGGTGKYQMIPGGFGKSRRDVHFAFNNGDLLLAEYFGQHGFQGFIGGRGEFRQLDHGAVARRQRGH